MFAHVGADLQPSARVTALLAEEASWGVGSPDRYRRFGDTVRAFRPLFGDFLGRLREEGKSVAGYGAAAKGTTLLNYCRIGGTRSTSSSTAAR